MSRAKCAQSYSLIQHVFTVIKCKQSDLNFCTKPGPATKTFHMKLFIENHIESLNVYEREIPESDYFITLDAKAV